MKLTQRKVDGFNIWFRKGKGEPSSDEQAIEEVLVKKCYVRPRLGFDVLPGETWLDLGANIGAFAAFCRIRGANTFCFEPEPNNFRILKKNLGAHSKAYNYAVTNRHDVELTFSGSKNMQNNYRGTVLPVENYVPLNPVLNMHASKMLDYIPKKLDGIKMDIEGSEGPLIDEWLLPRAEKLVLEYHHSRDRSAYSMYERIKILEDHYKIVRVPKAYTEYSEARISTLPRYDQLIFAQGLR